MLQTGLVAKSTAALIDDDIAVGRHSHDESGLVFGEFEPHRRRYRFHVPEIGSDFLRELDTVTLIAGMAIGVNGITRKELPFQLLVVFESAGSQDHASARASSRSPPR